MPSPTNYPLVWGSRPRSKPWSPSPDHYPTAPGAVHDPTIAERNARALLEMYQEMRQAMTAEGVGELLPGTEEEVSAVINEERETAGQEFGREEIT